MNFDAVCPSVVTTFSCDVTTGRSGGCHKAGSVSAHKPPTIDPAPAVNVSTTILSPVEISRVADREALRNSGHDHGSLDDYLEELPLTDHDRQHLHKLLLDEARRDALEMASQFLRMLAVRLKAYSPAGAALVAALDLQNGETLRDMGNAFKCSKQSVSNQLAVIRACLPELTPHLHSRKIQRPTEPGDWLTTAEACAEIGRAPDRLRELAPRCVSVGRQKFYDKADVLAKDAERKIRAAERQAKIDARRRDFERRCAM